MTEIYKAGEHVKIIKTDDGYNDTLGDQTGLVGTVKTEGSSVYVTFPHTGDRFFYYLASEIARAGTPLPEPVPVLTTQEKVLAEAGLKVGDKVKLTGGKLGTVTEHYRPESTNISVQRENGTTGYYPTYQVEKYTAPTYKAGDWAKITSNAYNAYSGKVFEVAADATTDSVTLNLIDPNDGHKWVGYFDTSAVEPAEKPKPQFKVGDRVEFVENYIHDVNKGDTGTITAGNYGNNFVSVKLDKDDRTVDPFSHRLKLSTKPKPFVPNFKVGDWVKVTGWGSSYEGTVYQVKAVPADQHSYYRFENAPGVGFSDAYLTATTEPFIPKFKVGDWVEITDCCPSNLCDGSKAQIKSVPTGPYDDYVLDRDEVPTFKNYRESFLKATTKPEEPHWTEAKPVGTATRIGARTLLKVEEDKWAIVYDTTHDTRPSVSSRNNQQTKALFSREPVEFASIN